MIPNDRTYLIYETIRSSIQYHSKKSICRLLEFNSRNIDAHLEWLSNNNWIHLSKRADLRTGGFVHLIKPVFRIYNGSLF